MHGRSAPVSSENRKIANAPFKWLEIDIVDICAVANWHYLESNLI